MDIGVQHVYYLYASAEALPKLLRRLSADHVYRLPQVVSLNSVSAGLAASTGIFNTQPRTNGNPSSNPKNPCLNTSQYHAQFSLRLGVEWDQSHCL